MVGGMPASVEAWVSTHDYTQCQAELDDIQLAYYDDFPKYAKKVDPTLLRNTLQSVVMQIGEKFTFSHVEGGYRAEEVKKALKLLCDAGIIKQVNHTAGNGLPLGAEVNEKFRKYIYLDSGLLLRILDLDLGGARQLTELIIAGTTEDLVNKGGLAEMMLGWELVKYNNPRTQHELYYWENTAEGTRVPQVREFLWIGTADIKDLYVEEKPFLGVLAELIRKGREVRLIHAKEPGPNFREDFDRYPVLIDRLERVLCPRVHFKIMIFDGTLAYIGSANLTGAGLGMKSSRNRNFEAGILTDDPTLVDAAMNQFDMVWAGIKCNNCGRKQVCPDPVVK